MSIFLQIKEVIQTNKLKTFFLFAWVFLWIFLFRHYFLDDSLIHLRYAENLIKTHMISYNGDFQTFGASSLLYIVLLGFFNIVWPTFYSVKIVSIIFYLMLLGSLFTFALKMRGKARISIFILIGAIISPMAIRWLTDGMETSLVSLFVLFISYISVNNLFRQSNKTIILFSSIFLIFLRVDLFFLIGVIVSGTMLFYFFSTKKVLSGFFSSIFYVLGAAISLLIIFMIFNQILPDTAVAKTTHIPSFGSLVSIIKASLATFLFGAFLYFAAIFSSFSVFKISLMNKEKYWPLFIYEINMIFFGILFIAMTCQKGMIVHGIRHFSWLLFFFVFSNIFILQKIEEDSSNKFRKFIHRTAATFVLIALPFEIFVVTKITDACSVNLLAMKNQKLEVLKNKIGVGGDIGYAGYFSQGKICDISGLVNGTENAKLHHIERIKNCMKKSPDFLFVDSEKVQAISSVSDINEWIVCYEYKWSNASFDFYKFLIVKPELLNSVCPNNLGSYREKKDYISKLR